MYSRCSWQKSNSTHRWGPTSASLCGFWVSLCGLWVVCGFFVVFVCHCVVFGWFVVFMCHCVVFACFLVLCHCVFLGWFVGGLWVVCGWFVVFGCHCACGFFFPRCIIDLNQRGKNVITTIQRRKTSQKTAQWSMVCPRFHGNNVSQLFELVSHKRQRQSWRVYHRNLLMLLTKR